MTFLIGQVLFGYRGAIFWKMTAGMGDVVIAPLYQALRRRGVKFEFFHRLDALHLDPSRQSVATIAMGRQAQLAEGLQHYEPLTKIRGLPGSPKLPLTEQLRRLRLGWMRRNRISAHMTMSKHELCEVVSISITWCSPCRLGWSRSWPTN